MRLLKEALPFLALDLEFALVHIGRGDVVNQLRESTIEAWSYDEHADAAYLHLRPAGGAGTAEAPGEKVSVFEELGIVIDTDKRGRPTGMEIVGGKAVVAQLEQGEAA